MIKFARFVTISLFPTIVLAQDPPREWIDPATHHRIIRLTDIPGSASLYFHQNGYTAKGDLTVFTSSGLVLPTRSTSGPFSTPNASTPPGSYYPGGGIPGVTLGGQDVTSQMVGGQIGADITLRDPTLPTGQAELDEFAYGVSSRSAGRESAAGRERRLGRDPQCPRGQGGRPRRAAGRADTRRRQLATRSATPERLAQALRRQAGRRAEKTVMG